ncbi:MAG: phage baseplate assembly protein V, partial [Zoogloeaceae bacterium]|nr:phage baseplate assembly protein V [Zoogloeaceae bacterium]
MSDPLSPDLSRRLESMIRIGRVVAVDPAAARCRVKSGELETEFLPWLERRMGETRDWDPPTIGEQVMVLSPSGEVAGGIVLTGIPSDASPPP